MEPAAETVVESGPVSVLMDPVDDFGRRLLYAGLRHREQFLAQHIDLKDTHELCLYPRRESREEDTTSAEQTMVLKPITDRGEYTEEEAKTLFPHFVSIVNLTVVNPLEAAE